MVNLRSELARVKMERDILKNFLYQLILYVALLTKLRSGFPWNHSPDCAERLYSLRP